MAQTENVKEAMSKLRGSMPKTPPGGGPLVKGALTLIVGGVGLAALGYNSL
jgi:hypothetical protein